MSKTKARVLLELFAFSRTKCAVCWLRKYSPGGTHEIHHIVGRRGGSPHDHRNLVLLCRACHYGFHSGGKRSLSLGQVLEAKREEAGEVDVEFLAGLLKRTGLREDPLPLPQWALDARATNDGR